MTSRLGTVKVDVLPTVTSLQLVNGGSTAGKVEQGDRIVVTFSKQMSVSSFCSTWSGDTSNQSLAGSNDVAVRVTSGGALTVTSATCSFNFGDIDLGSTGYVFLFPAVFQGSGSDASTVAWNASAKKLTIVLGLLQPSLTLMGTVSSSVATYTPSGAVTDSAGNAVAGPFSTGNVKQF